MRRSLAPLVFVLPCWLTMAGCAGTSPQGLGLTGAPVPAPPVTPPGEQLGQPGLEATPNISTPSLTPYVLQPGGVEEATPGAAAPSGY